MLSQDEARKIIEKALGYGSGSELQVSLGGGSRGDTRFAVNTATTSGYRDSIGLAVTARFGKRSGSSTTNTLTDESIARTVRAAETIAKFSPEDPETMPLLGPQQYTPVEAFDEATASAGPDWRSKLAAGAIEPAKALMIDKRIGSLEVGKDADILVVTGSIIDPRSYVTHVFIDGRVVYDTKKDRRRF